MAEQPDSFDPEALGVADLGGFVDSAPKRTGKKKFKALAEERAERKTAKAAKDNAPSPTPHAITAALIRDPQVREIEGRRLHAELGRRKAALIVERQAISERGPSNPERTAEIEARFADNPQSWECKQACNQIGADYVFELERRTIEIDALEAEQVEISHAYARPELKAGHAAMSAWIEAASAAAAQRKTEAQAAAWNENGPPPREARPLRRQQARIFITPRQPAPEAVEAAAPAEAGEAAAFETPSWIDEGEREPVIWDGPETAAQETPQEPRGGQVETKTDDEALLAEGPPQGPPEAPPETPPEPEPEEPQPEAEAEAEPEPDSETWPKLTFSAAANILDRLNKAKRAASAKDAPTFEATLHEIETLNAAATVWELAEWPDNPSRLNRAHTAQTHFRSTFEDLLGKDAPAYERSLKKLAKALHLRLEAETMLKPESAGDLGSALTRMSKTHAVAMIRNKTRVIRIDPPPPRSAGNPGPPILRAFSKQDFLDLYANERYPVGDEQVSVAKIWFVGGRRTYKDGVEFDPSHIGTREGALAVNLYWGLAYEPLPADPSIDPFAGVGWSILRAHMVDNMAPNDFDGFKYALCWYADIVQNPANKKGTALVFRGGQGVGKSTIVEMFGRLFGPHDHYVSKTDGVAGKFNEALLARLHVAIEEAVWAGDRVAEGVMKDLKTSLRININPKGIAEFSAANHCRFVILGNPKWLIAAPEDDRRDTVYQFADGNKGKTKTFAAMWAEMEGGGFRALLRDLTSINLKTVTIKGAPLDLREPHATAALIEQKERSMETEQAWLKDLLRQGEIRHPYEMLETEPGLRGGPLVPLDALMVNYQAYARDIGDRGRKSDESMIGKLLVEIFGDALGPRIRITANKVTWNNDGSSYASLARPRCRRFPSLEEARRRFLRFFKSEGYADWFDDETVDGSGVKAVAEWNVRHELVSAGDH